MRREMLSAIDRTGLPNGLALWLSRVDAVSASNSLALVPAGDWAVAMSATECCMAENMPAI